MKLRIVFINIDYGDVLISEEKFVRLKSRFFSQAEGRKLKSGSQLTRSAVRKSQKDAYRARTAIRGTAVDEKHKDPWPFPSEHLCQQNG